MVRLYEEQVERRSRFNEPVSRLSYQAPVRKTIRSPSLSTISSYLSKPTYNVVNETKIALENGSYSDIYQPSWFTKTRNGSGYDDTSEYLNGSYLNNDDIYTKTKHSPSSFQTKSYQQPTPARSYYSSATNQPSSFTTPPSQPLSILNRYINSQIYPSSSNNYSSGLTYDRFSCKPPLDLTNYKGSLPSKYDYKVPNDNNLNHYNDDIHQDIYPRSVPPLKRSQSYQVSDNAYIPSSEVHLSSRESISRPRYRESDSESRYISSYKPTNLNYDYHQDLSSVRNQQPYQNPYKNHYQQHKLAYQPTQRETTPDSHNAQVVAETNVVSSRTSAQRDLGPGVSNERRSFSVLQAMNAVPSRSRSVVVTKDHPLNRGSLVSRPRSTMITNRPGSMMITNGRSFDMSCKKTTSVGTTSRPPSYVSSPRYSVVPHDRRSRVCDDRSSVVASSDSMFEVEPSKTNSHFETTRGYKNSRGKYDSLGNLNGNLNGRSSKTEECLRNSMVERRRSRPGRMENQENKGSYESRYRPSSTEKVRSYTGSLYGVHIPDSFTPTISETRKKARDVLCRVRKDPNYFSFK